MQEPAGVRMLIATFRCGLVALASLSVALGDAAAQTPTYELDSTSSRVARDSRRKPQVQMFQKSCDGAALISTHQPGRSNGVYKEDRGQSALLTRQRHPPRVTAEA
jgi:hypothetical protein